MQKPFFLCLMPPNLRKNCTVSKLRARSCPQICIHWLQWNESWTQMVSQWEWGTEPCNAHFLLLALTAKPHWTKQGCGHQTCFPSNISHYGLSPGSLTKGKSPIHFHGSFMYKRKARSGLTLSTISSSLQCNRMPMWQEFKWEPLYLDLLQRMLQK